MLARKKLSGDGLCTLALHGSVSYHRKLSAHSPSQRRCERSRRRETVARLAPTWRAAVCITRFCTKLASMRLWCLPRKLVCWVYMGSDPSHTFRKVFSSLAFICRCTFLGIAVEYPLPRTSHIYRYQTVPASPPASSREKGISQRKRYLHHHLLRVVPWA